MKLPLAKHCEKIKRRLPKMGSRLFCFGISEPRRYCKAAFEIKGVHFMPLWWSRAELKRTLSLVILYCVNCGFYWDLDCIFIAGEAEHQPQIIVISIHRDQECVK